MIIINNTSYYTMLEFKKMDIVSKSNIIKMTYLNSITEYKTLLKKELSKGVDIDTISLDLYMMNRFQTLFIPEVTFYNTELLCCLYSIFLKSKQLQLNLFKYIINSYYDINKHYNLDTQSDIITLLLEINLKEVMKND